MPISRRSPSTQTLIQFIREAKMDEDWTFKCARGDGPDYLQRMRVQLSKFKQKIRSRGAQPRQFKIILVACNPIETEEGLFDNVTIRMTLSNGAKLDQELSEIFQSLTKQDTAA